MKNDNRNAREVSLLNLYFTAIDNQKQLLDQNIDLAAELARVCRKLREIEDE